MVKHIESWNVEPSAVVKSLLKPSAKKPSNSWEKSVLGLKSPSLGMPSLEHAGSTGLFWAIHFIISASPCALSVACGICLSCT